MAASTRLERIQYKEIPTPGWRTANDMLNDDEADLDVCYYGYISLRFYFHFRFSLIVLGIMR